MSDESYLLDTQILLWMDQRPEKITRRLQATLDAGFEIYFSAASAWEIAIKCSLGKLSINRPLNALAESSPGFVWRLQTPEGNATTIRPFENENMLINMSVWQDADSLRKFVYRSAHADILSRRREWFSTTHIKRASSPRRRWLVLRT